jgi:hypothetical protein
MTRRRPGALIRSALVAVAVAAAMWLVWPDVVRGAWVAAYGLAGGILIVRRPRNGIGWLLALVALSFTGLNDLAPKQVAAVAAGDTDPVTDFRVWVGAMSGAWAFLGYALLGLVFPTGRLPAGRWHGPLIGLVAVALVVTVVAMISPTVSATIDGGTATLMVPNPYALAPDAAIWSVLPNADVAFLPVVALLVVSVVAVVVRARRSTGTIRLQMRWLAAALAGLLAAIATGAALVLIVGPEIGDLAWLPASVAFLTIPAAILIAVLRHRLLDIDRVISRTIGWALASGVLAAIFLGGVAALQALLVDVTQGSTLAVAASTLLTAASFQPIRRRLQHAVDRHFDRAGHDRDRILTTVRGRLRDEVDLATIQDHVLASTAEAVRPASSGIWLRPRASR